MKKKKRKKIKRKKERKKRSKKKKIFSKVHQRDSLVRKKIEKRYMIQKAHGR